MLPHIVVAFVLERGFLIMIELADIFGGRINVQNIPLLAIFDQHIWCNANRKINTESFLALENLVQDLYVILVSESYLHELNFLVLIWGEGRIGIDYSHFVEWKMSLNERDCASTD